MLTQFVRVLLNSQNLLITLLAKLEINSNNNITYVVTYRAAIAANNTLYIDNIFFISVFCL